MKMAKTVILTVLICGALSVDLTSILKAKLNAAKPTYDASKAESLIPNVISYGSFYKKTCDSSDEQQFIICIIMPKFVPVSKMAKIPWLPFVQFKILLYAERYEFIQQIFDIQPGKTSSSTATGYIGIREGNQIHMRSFYGSSSALATQPHDLVKKRVCKRVRVRRFFVKKCYDVQSNVPRGFNYNEISTIQKRLVAGSYGEAQKVIPDSDAEMNEFDMKDFKVKRKIIRTVKVENVLKVMSLVTKIVEDEMRREVIEGIKTEKVFQLNKDGVDYFVNVNAVGEGIVDLLIDLKQ